MSENHAGAGLVQPPGQIEHITGERGELFRAIMRTIAFSIAGDILLLILGAGVVIVGPQAVALVGGAVGMALAVAGWWYRYIDGVIALLLGSALAACGTALGHLLGPALWQFVIAHPKYSLLPFGIPWLAGILAFMMATGIAILDKNWSAPRQAVARITPIMPWSKETQDVPPGPQAPEQVTERHETVIKVQLNDSGSYDKATLPMHPNTLKRLAEIAVKDGLSEAKMAGGNKPLAGRNEFHDFRNLLLEWGWAAWNNPNAPQQGLSLTRRGLQICSKLSGSNGSPTPAPVVRGRSF